MANANETISDDRHIVLRIGINLGDIVGEGSDIYGDGVNIAARLEALSEPAGICISGKVFEETTGKLDAVVEAGLVMEDMGEVSLKTLPPRSGLSRQATARSSPLGRRPTRSRLQAVCCCAAIRQHEW